MIKKSVFSFLGALLIFVFGFYFWGSSRSIPKNSGNAIFTSETSFPRSEQDTFSLITYNLGYLSGMTNNRAVDRTPVLFEDNMNKMLSLLKAIQPDFIAFQEIDIDADRSYEINQVEALRSQHPFPHSATSVNWNKTYVPFPYWPVSNQFGKIISGQALLSNYPVLGQDIIELEKPVDNPFYYNAYYLDRLIQVVKLQVGIHQVVVINVHLEAFHGNTRDDQIKRVLHEFHKYSEDFAVLLCGDFNSTPPGASLPYQDDHVIQTLLNDYQIEMAINLEENTRNEKQYLTFNSEHPDRRLDYIFYNPKFIQIVDARVVHEAGQISDHLPVWMKFTFR